MASLKARHFSSLALELFVVIIGVFIGIQVSNWNDARIDQGRAHSYLERITADLDADINNYADRLAFWDQVFAYGVRVLDFVETGDTGDADAWDLLLAYFQASQLAEFYTTRSTYDELKSGGEIGLIGDLELRKLLAHYYTNAANPVLTERPAYREHVRGLVPFGIQGFIWQHCYAADDMYQQMLDCDAPVDDDEAGRILAMLRANDALTADLRYWMSAMTAARILGRNRLELARQLRQRTTEGFDSVD